MTTKQPEALRLADALTTLTGTQKDKHTTAKQAAAELRRLHTENEAKDALLRQALDALEYASDMTNPDDDDLQGCDCTICISIAALRERLSKGEQ